MLSSNSALAGSPFGPISDLGLEDGLPAGPFTVNLLPVLMTLINILSGYIYARRQPFKVRLQLYLMAAVFPRHSINLRRDWCFTGRSTTFSRS